MRIRSDPESVKAAFARRGEGTEVIDQALELDDPAARASPGSATSCGPR